MCITFNVHWKWCTCHRKASAKNSSKLDKFLHSEVNNINTTYYSARSRLTKQQYCNQLFGWIFCTVIWCCVVGVLSGFMYVSFVLWAKFLILVCIVLRLSVLCSCVILVYLSAPVIVRAALFFWSLCILLSVCDMHIEFVLVLMMCKLDIGCHWGMIENEHIKIGSNEKWKPVRLFIDKSRFYSWGNKM